MMDSHRARHDHLQDLLVRRDIRSREGLLADQHWLDGLALENRPGALEACDGDLLVSFVGEPVRVHDRVVDCVARVDGDGATGERCDDGNAD